MISIEQCADWSCMCPLVPDFLQEPLLSASDVLALNENGTWKILDEVCLPIQCSIVLMTLSS